MSTAAAPESRPTLLPTVTHRYLPHPDSEMSVIGWLLFGIMLVILFPLVPFVAVVWLAATLGKKLRRGGRSAV